MLITILVNAQVIPTDLWNFKSKADCSQGVYRLTRPWYVFLAVAYLFTLPHSARLARFLDLHRDVYRRGRPHLRLFTRAFHYRHDETQCPLL